MTEERKFTPPKDVEFPKEYQDRERHNRTIDTLNDLIDNNCEDNPFKAKLLERMKKRLEELHNE